MTTDEFNKVVDERIQKIKDTLLAKGKEYSTDDNKMHNFDRGAKISGKKREIVLWGFALKHYISFMDILDNIERSKYPTKEVIDEKIGDLINYLILCEASIKDTIDE
jgi:hypothetical protein